MKITDYICLYSELSELLYNERLQLNSEWEDEHGERTASGHDGIVECVNLIESILGDYINIED